MKIGIVGIGMVGSQVKAWFESQNADLVWYDPAHASNTWEEMEPADVFFVCVPTPYKDGEGYDLSILSEVINIIPDGKTVVIKSTVNPGTTDGLQKLYPNKVFMFNPEFLTEATAHDDFFKPDMQILGVPKEGYAKANEIMSLLPPAPLMRIVSPVDAEWVKKLRNAFYAVKVTFFNEIYDLMQNTPADYETIRSIVVNDKMIGNSHSVIWHKGYRGFGNLKTSKCLPKDLFSLIDFADRMELNADLLKTAKKKNEKYDQEKI